MRRMSLYLRWKWELLLSSRRVIRFFSLKADIRRICLAGDPLVYVVYKLEFSLCL